MTELIGAGAAADNDLIDLSADIVCAYVSHNALSVTDLPKLIADVHAALRGLQSPVAAVAAEEQKPAVAVRKSVAPDYSICLEDGKKLKMLKRHLKSAYNMSPEQYRERWGLPPEYPMVAPNYAKKCSQLARDLGLGTKAKRRRGGNGD